MPWINPACNRARDVAERKKLRFCTSHTTNKSTRVVLYISKVGKKRNVAFIRPVDLQPAQFMRGISWNPSFSILQPAQILRG